MEQWRAEQPVDGLDLVHELRDNPRWKSLPARPQDADEASVANVAKQPKSVDKRPIESE